MKNKTGFTLVELLVVIAIIAILVSIGLASYTQAGKNARDAKKKTEIETVRQAMILYRSEKGLYPTGNFAQITTELSLPANGFLSTPVPTGHSYTSPCICALMENSANGNSTLNNASCTVTGATGTYYCARLN